MTLGQAIGIVRHSFSITNDAKDKVQLAIDIDFRTSSDIDIKSWLAGSRTIAGQRPWRAMSVEELREMNGQTFQACDIGRKVKTRTERMAIYTAAGFPEDLAALAVDRPDLLQKVSVEGIVDEEKELNENIDETK